MERLLPALKPLSNIALECLGIHKNIQGTVQNYQDTVSDRKDTQSRILILLSGHKQQNIQLCTFPQLYAAINPPLLVVLHWRKHIEEEA